MIGSFIAAEWWHKKAVAMQAAPEPQVRMVAGVPRGTRAQIAATLPDHGAAVRRSEKKPGDLRQESTAPQKDVRSS